MAKITINGITLDPLDPRRSLAGARLELADAASSDYVLVQTAQPLDKAQKAALAGAGAAVLEYVPDNTYLCDYAPGDLAPLRALPFVTWAHTYLRGFKIAPSLISLPPGPKLRPLLDMAALPQQHLVQDSKTVDIVLHKDVDPSAVCEQVAAAAGIDADDVQAGAHKIRLTVQVKRLPQLAALDVVRHIEQVFPLKLHNDVARVILNIEPANLPPLTYAGAGQRVAVADTGFDKGSTSDVHPAFTGRVDKLYALGRSNKSNDPDGHGTHVCGSVLGDGQSATLGLAIRGAAPKAHLVMQSVLDAKGGLGGLPDDLHDLFQPPYGSDQARVHSNSWGSTVADGRYDQNAREVDDFVWSNRDMVICFAAGNDGKDGDSNGLIDAQSVSPPGTAKNCITVGASENHRPAKTITYGAGWPSEFPAAPIFADKVADNPDGIVAFSSRGPTSDRRIKPDLVAPGTYILSSRSRATSSEGWELSADPLYMYEGGTSMATPLVAGCVALVREYLAEQHAMATPSAALVKALLINGAHNVAGQYVPSEAGGTPNNAEGFGRVDMAATVGPLPQGVTLTLHDEATALDTGEEESFTVTVGKGADLKVTLVWTDPAGDTLQNDLDLNVKAANRKERHGNMAATSTAFDRVNNVEQVVWTNLPAGAVTVTVRAFRAAQFAQSYALVLRVSA